MAILAIDPGPTVSGYAVWGFDSLISFGIIPSEQVLTSDFYREHCPSVTNCLIETVVSYGMAVGVETFDTCRMIGRYQERWSKLAGTEAILITRQEVKLHHCHASKAKDANIRQALIDRFGGKGTKKNPGPFYGVSSHAWSAIAIAVYGYDIQIKGEAVA